MGFSLSGGPSSSTSSHTTNNNSGGGEDSSQEQLTISTGGAGNVSTNRLDTHGGAISLVDSSNHTGIDPSLALASINRLTETIFGGLGRFVETGFGGNGSDVANKVPDGSGASAVVGPRSLDVGGIFRTYGLWIIGGLGVVGAVVLVLVMGKKGKRRA
jgi:hypothetical protein